MPVAVRGGRLSQRSGVTLTGLGKDLRGPQQPLAETKKVSPG